jgi:Ca2+-binding RTX toxin-like protein
MTTPSPTVNTFVLAEDGRYNFSDFSDDVDLENFGELYGEFVRMLNGNDVVRAPNLNSPGWDITVNGNLGGDTLIGRSWRDYLLGGKENDTISGGGREDWLNGNRNDDTVRGGSFNDIVRGGKGNDFVRGDSGNDILTGDFGKDLLEGGIGADRFMVRTDSSETDEGFLSNLTPNATEADVITDFSFGQNDRVVISGVQSRDQLSFSNFNGDAAISVDLGNGPQFAVVLDGVSVFQLTANANTAIIIGATADDFLSKINPDYFLTNPNRATELIS